MKIYQNFSNYSAWQRRSHFFSQFLIEHVSGNEQKTIEFLRNEVELCRNAAWTEPSDQSVWFYQRWLFTFLKTCPLISKDFVKTLVEEQVNSILELIKEENYQSSVSLAVSFIIFMIKNVQDKEDLTEAGKKIISEFKELLERIDPLREDHWKEIKNS